MKKGFSIIEILIATAIFAILALVVAQTVLTSFRSTRRSDSSSTVRENLELASAVVERHIRNAKFITSTCTGAQSGRIDYLNEKGLPGSFSCVTNSGGQFVASGSANIRVTSADVTLTGCNFTCTPSVNNPPTPNQ